MKTWMKYLLTIVLTAAVTALIMMVIMLTKENRELRDQMAGQTAAPAPIEIPVETTVETMPSLSFMETDSDAAALRSEISELEEVTAYFDERFPEIWMSAHLTDGVKDYFWLASGEEIVQRPPDNAVGRSCIVNAATYLLSDDMEIYSVIGFRHDESGGCPLMAVNCIRTESCYRFVDPVLGMRGDEGSRYGALLPEATVASLEEYVQLLQSDPEIMRTLDYLYLFEGGQVIEFYEDNHGLVTLKSPDMEPLFHNAQKLEAEEQARAQAMAHIKPENIGSYELSTLLGGITLSPEEAYTLVDADPETVKEAVKTAGDVLMYMLAAKIGDNGGCYCTEWDGYTWHTNFTAKEVMERKLSNCGASANLANYLLEDDYEEVGFILHAYYPGNGGGHVYNYFLYEGKYYIVDFSWYIFAGYAPSQDFPVLVLDRLEDYTGDTIGQLFGGVSLAIAHTSPGQHLPNIFGEEYGEIYYYVPQGSEYTLLYEAGDGYRIAEKPLNPKYHDYTIFWPGCRAS